MQNMVIIWFTPLCAIAYAIAYAITNSMKNLRFDKEGGYFHVLFFYWLFYKRNRNETFPPLFAYVIDLLSETHALPARVASSISCSPKLPLMFL